jgi:glycosyltransferase involved in cell wall biosynthesis
MSNELSVIIPAYRAAHTIGRAVDSVLGQTQPPGEVLVVDDGSPDDLVGALRPYGSQVTLLRQPQGGAASARNLGLERARGQLIAFLDADDHWEPDKVERQLAVLQRHPEVGLVAGQFFEEVPGHPRILGARPLGPESYDRVLRAVGEDAFTLGTRIWTGTVLVRREVVGKERFVPGLEPAEDRDLWVRLVTACPVYLMAQPLATAVLNPGSLSRSSIDRDCRNMLRVIRRHAGLLGARGLRRWEADTYRRWAGNHLAQGRPQEAAGLAWKRLRLEPWSPAAWWVLAKAAVRCPLAVGRRPEQTFSRENLTTGQ